MEIRKESNAIEMICHTVNYRVDPVQRFHWHEKYEICQLLNTDCTFFAGGQNIHASPGDLIVFDFKEIHRFVLSQDHTQVRILQFPPKALLNSGLPAGWIKPHITRAELQQHPALERAVTALMELMEAEAAVPKDEKNAVLQSLMVSLCIWLQKYFPATEKNRTSKDVAMFFEIIEYVNAHFDDEASTVENIAQQLGISREKLSAVFLRHAGTSLKNYINTSRVDYANHLLQDGWNISTASFKCGFNNIRTFNSVYKSVMKMTPSEYLRTHHLK